MTKTYRVLGTDRKEYDSVVPGTLGGYRPKKIYGRLDWFSALRALAKKGTGYAQHRVFFLDEASAIAAGYRPCGKCMKAEYLLWKERMAPESSAGYDDC